MPTMTENENMSRVMCETRAALLHAHSRGAANPRERELLADMAHAHGLYATQPSRPLLSAEELKAMEKLPFG